MSWGKGSCSLFIFIILMGIVNLSSPMSSQTRNAHSTNNKFDVVNQTIIQLNQSSPIHITDDSGFTVFPGTGTQTNPYRLENLNITSDSSNYGINISDTTVHFIIKNCIIKAKQVGIWISWISYGTADIRDNIIQGHDSYGIDLWGAPGTIIQNNTVNSNDLNGINCIDSDNLLISDNVINKNNKNGISVRFSDDVVVQDNFCEDNLVGIEIYFSRNPVVKRNYCFKSQQKGFYFWEIAQGYILENKVHDNLGNGILLKDSIDIILNENDISNNSIGFYFDESHNSEIYNNSITDDRNKGIYLENSNGNKITFNFILRNNGYGVVLNYSSNNIIHHNNFIQNNLGGISQAHSRYGSGNYWYDIETKEGNYWDEWSGVGAYSIEGFWGESDLYPLVNPVDIPRIEEEKPSWIFYFLVIIIPITICGALVYLISFIRKRHKISFTRKTKETANYIDIKRKIAYGEDMGVGLFRFGLEGGEIILADLESFKINTDEFIGFSYVTVGQGQRYETGVYGPLPAPSLIDYSMIIFAFWGRDDIQSDPRFGDRQYYVVSVVFPEKKTKHINKNDVMKKKFNAYIKKFDYPNRMSIEELNFFKELVFV